MEDQDVRVTVARLEERLKASDMALKLAADSLDAWKANSALWLQVVKDQQGKFISRPEVISILLVGLTLLGLIMKYGK